VSLRREKKTKEESTQRSRTTTAASFLNREVGTAEAVETGDSHDKHESCSGKKKAKKRTDSDVEKNRGKRLRREKSK